MEKHIFLAFDLGATSGRSILGTVADGKVEIKELTRFPNAVTELHGKYYWNLMGLYQALREGLVACSKEGIVPESIGIDTWGVDVASFNNIIFCKMDIITYMRSYSYSFKAF